MKEKQVYPLRKTDTDDVGVAEEECRLESDSLGNVKVPAKRLWGAQTQRSLLHFSIGDDLMPKAIYHSYGYVKKAAAIVNSKLGKLDKKKADLICKIADEIIAGDLDREFPLYVWQTGSGTQTNMNVNEVIANRALQLLNLKLGSKSVLHPNDDINMSQSSNDTFPTAMHIATVLSLKEHLIPNAKKLSLAILEKAKRWTNVIKIGRTHLQDATPLTVGQELSGYVAQINDALEVIEFSLNGLYKLAAGGTAVGTGINCPPDYDIKFAQEIAKLTGLPFVTAPNKFAAQGSLDAMVFVSSAIRLLAVALLKIANDIRWLGSGPRAGIYELILPENEPGSSIMPGKVNPTQAEALIMVCIQIFGNDTAVGFAGSQGNFELNAMRPLIIKNVLHSATILSDACEKFNEYCIAGLEINEAKIDEYVNQSLMLVTVLSPVIGYDKSSEIAHSAFKNKTTLKEAAILSGYITEEEYDKLVDPKKLVGNPKKDINNF